MEIIFGDIGFIDEDEVDEGKGRRVIIDEDDFGSVEFIVAMFSDEQE